MEPVRLDTAGTMQISRLATSETSYAPRQVATELEAEAYLDEACETADG